MAELLLVEDNHDVATMLVEMLGMEGHAVRAARDGLEGLKQLDARFPQLVISDVEMPELDGPGMIYRMFVANLGRENIPIVLMSGSQELEAVARAIGTPYWIAKPFAFARLVALIARALHEARPPQPDLGARVDQEA